MDWLESIFRFLFAWIDKIIAWAIEQAYELFVLIADTNIFSAEVLVMFSRRVYALLAIFMLFKMAFSLINYIINPDDFSDKGKGAGKLITNVFIVLALIVSMPYIFSAAYDLQGKIIKNSVIQKVVLGVGGSSGPNVSPGKIMAFTVYSAFITPNPDYPGMKNADDTSKCETLYSKREVTADCEGVVRTAAGDNGLILLKNAVNAYDSQSLLDYDLVVNAKTNGKFLFNYTPIISSICAGLVAWLILLFCIDISIRVVKLGFLQLIAPIPIISYMDPKSSKDGMFKKWTKVCLTTYGDIFIRLLAISFAIFIINIIGAGKITQISDPTKEISFVTHPFVKIFILLGALLFAKQLPKLIEDLTGVKLSGDFSLNPMKKIGSAPLIGGAATAGLSYGANLAKGGLAAGHGLGKSLFQQARGDSLGAADTRNNIGSDFNKRMSAARTEASGRFAASGFAGSDKYSGETASAALKKEGQEDLKKSKAAEITLANARNLWEQGKRSSDATTGIPDLDTTNIADTYGKVFKNEGFIKSLVNVDKAKDLAKVLEQDYAVAQANLNSDPTNPANATALQTARENFNKHTKTLSALEKTHETISQIYSDDARTETARKVAKGPRP